MDLNNHYFNLEKYEKLNEEKYVTYTLFIESIFKTKDLK